MSECRLDDHDLSLLGLGSRAEWEEVQAAYRRLAMQLHPDRTRSAAGATEPESVVPFRTVNEAYERLRKRRTEARLNSPEHITRISEDPTAASLEVDELVLRLRHSSSPQVRAVSALLLGRHPGPRSTSALRAACNDRDPRVRDAAFEALKNGGSEWELLRAKASAWLRKVRKEARE